MGQLVEGKWEDVWYDTKSTNGRFVRQNAAFRNWITPDGERGPPVIVDSERSSVDTTSTCHWPAPGHIER